MTTNKLSVAQVIAKLFGTSQKALSEKLATDEFNSFAAEAQELQDRIDAQEQGNTAIQADLTQAQADLVTAQASLTTATADVTRLTNELATANSTISTLKPSADAWTAHKAALDGTQVADDSTNTQTGKKVDTGLSTKDQAHLDKMQNLKAKYPGLMADINVPVQE